MRAFVLLLLGAAGAFSQPLSFGVKGGLPLTDFFDTVSTQGANFNAGTKQYIVGPTVELRLPAGFGIEFDALYRRFHYDSNFNLLGAVANVATTGNAWEFPLLLKKKFAAGPVRPFVDGGVSFDRISGLTKSVKNLAQSPSALKNNFAPGIAIGGGIDFHLFFLHITPEIRYTRWTREHFSQVQSGGSLNSNQNQAEFLVGFTF